MSYPERCRSSHCSVDMLELINFNKFENIRFEKGLGWRVKPMVGYNRIQIVTYSQRWMYIYISGYKT